MDFYSFLFLLSLIGIIQGFFLAFLLYNRSGKNPLLSRLIASLFFAGAFVMLLITVVNAGLVIEHPIITILEFFIGLIVGPLLICSINIFFTPQGKKIVSFLPHFVLPFGFLCYALFCLSVGKDFHFPVLWIMIHLQLYTVYGIMLFWWNQKQKRAIPSGKHSLWLSFLLFFYTFIGLAQWIRFSFSNLEQLNLIIPVSASFMLYGVFMKGFKRSLILPQSKRSHIISSSRSLAWIEIEQKIFEQQLYKEKGLSISQLALQLGISPHQLSTAFRQNYTQNFSSYINSLRVDYAKQLLADSTFDPYTVEAIGHESGFQSRSVFYKYFKEQTGLTPAAFKENVRVF